MHLSFWPLEKLEATSSRFLLCSVWKRTFFVTFSTNAWFIISSHLFLGLWKLENHSSLFLRPLKCLQPCDTPSVTVSSLSWWVPVCLILRKQVPRSATFLLASSCPAVAHQGWGDEQCTHHSVIPTDWCSETTFSFVLIAFLTFLNVQFSIF